jgi:hypothetical protein
MKMEEMINLPIDFSSKKHRKTLFRDKLKERGQNFHWPRVGERFSGHSICNRAASQAGGAVKELEQHI